MHVKRSFKSKNTALRKRNTNETKHAKELISKTCKVIYCITTECMKPKTHKETTTLLFVTVKSLRMRH